MELVVSPAGLVRCIYGETIDLSALGCARIRRASFVEPDKHGQWQVDFAPLEGPVVGSFTARSEALAFELNWLKQHWLLASADA